MNARSPHCQTPTSLCWVTMTVEMPLDSVNTEWVHGLMTLSFVLQHSFFLFRISQPFFPLPPSSTIFLRVQGGSGHFLSECGRPSIPAHPLPPTTPLRLFKILEACPAETLHPSPTLSPASGDMVLPMYTGALQQLAPNSVHSRLGILEWPGGLAS